MVKQMENHSLPFVVKKIKKAENQDGNYYLFGTKCILVTKQDDDTLVVQEEKSYGQIDFQSFIAKNKDQEWVKIKRMLKGTHTHLQQKDDPVLAICEMMEEMWLKQLE